MMSDELQQTLRPRQNRGEGGVMGLLAECMAMMRQTDTTGVTGDSWLRRGRQQMAAETDKLSCTDTNTDHGLPWLAAWRSG